MSTSFLNRKMNNHDQNGEKRISEVLSKVPKKNKK